MAGLRQPQEGVVTWGKHANIWSLKEPDITLVRRATCGFVFQFPAFLDNLTVATNIATPLVVSGTRPRRARERARTWLDRFDLGPLTEKDPSTLSSGELQRASIARALTMHPSIVFCDEPTGALDEKNSGMVVAELRRIAEEFDVGVLIVTHDPAVSAAADRVLRLDRGRLIGQGHAPCN